VVADLREAGLDREPAMYVPVAQLSDSINRRNNNLVPLTWVIRAEGPTAAAIAVRELSALSGRPVGAVRTMHEMIAASSARAEFYTLVLLAFAAIALLLAAAGLYAVMSFFVQQRVKEIGIRMALGASPGDVRGMVVFQGLRLAALGALAGVPAALALVRITMSLVFGVQTWDPSVLVLVTVLLALTAFFASYLPSVRASRVDPARALK
jgi:ABC-type antimicrobial peptide transport system permease subunit